MKLRSALLVPVLALGVAAAACGDDDGDRRVIAITQTDEVCTPASIDLNSGEKVTFEVRNDGKKDHEVEGIEGTKLEEVLVPAGRTRNVKYTAPKSAGTQKIKCYVPGGSSTIIEVKVSGASGAIEGNESGSGAAKSTKKSKNTVKVELAEFSVAPNRPSVPAGPTKFEAKNISKSDVHELAIMRVKDDGSFDNLGEVEDLGPGKSGEVVVDLAKGRYLLACLIVPGEAGSRYDHFKEGMKIEFEVT